jgi:hypothetical protein
MYILRYVSGEKAEHTGTVRNTPYHLSPSNSQLDGFSCGFLTSRSPMTLKVSVEYVEFTDGTYWGTDASMWGAGRGDWLAE